MYTSSRLPCTFSGEIAYRLVGQIRHCGVVSNMAAVVQPTHHTAHGGHPLFFLMTSRRCHRPYILCVRSLACDIFPPFLLFLIRSRNCSLSPIVATPAGLVHRPTRRDGSLCLVSLFPSSIASPVPQRGRGFIHFCRRIYISRTCSLCRSNEELTTFSNADMHCNL